jgi:hypothetical protein
MVIDATEDVRRCVVCNFVESRPSGDTQLPLTRVTRAAARRVDTAADPIKILDT